MKKKKRPPLAKRYIVRNVLILVLSLVLLVGGVGCIYVDNIMAKGNYVNDRSSLLNTPLTASAVDSGTKYSTNGANQINGMLKDEAITNILVIGVDDYQKDDPIGRSDSMMIISLDNRHKKLKLTSFLRDTYVAIPNNGSNKLNAAYHFGAYNTVEKDGAKAGDATSVNAGAQLCIKTLELNFGMYIDRYVVVKDSVFDSVIDALGGVDVNITAKEAGQINCFSGSTAAKLKGVNGVQHLDGAQAHYFGRIRLEGYDKSGNNITIPNVYGHYGDVGRAERQRMVVTAIVNKFKKSDLQTISSLATQVLSKVITNFSRNEVYSILGQAATVMNYPMKQNQVPAEGNYDTPLLDVGDVVQIKDNKKLVNDALTFLYENDKPDVSKIALAAMSSSSSSSSADTTQSDSSTDNGN
ncbi:MAG: LCP family protein [Oscillospiraceae bacterium]|nr:LCP family protein [Oscillospiraceae bacterium]MDD3260550.1 LCP family protein [Oscillospiraceae bacterium]